MTTGTLDDIGLRAFPAPRSAKRVHDEEAFRYFLELERRRAERSGRSFLLVLVDVKRGPGHDATMSPAVARGVFSAFGLSLRQVDFVGWFRESRIVGAVLAQPRPPSTDVRRVVVDRISRNLALDVPADIASVLRVRVVRGGAKKRP